MNEETKNNFEPGDLVAVFGGEIGKEGKSANHVSICIVLVCGKQDLIVEDRYTRSYVKNSYHKVPQRICHKLSLDPDNLWETSTLSPSVGDLVLSYTRDSFREEEPEQITGILYKTTFKLGKPHKSTLICGDEMKEVSYDSLLVLQRN